MGVPAVTGTVRGLTNGSCSRNSFWLYPQSAPAVLFGDYSACWCDTQFRHQSLTDLAGSVEIILLKNFQKLLKHQRIALAVRSQAVYAPSFLLRCSHVISSLIWTITNGLLNSQTTAKWWVRRQKFASEFSYSHSHESVILHRVGNVVDLSSMPTNRSRMQCQRHLLSPVNSTVQEVRHCQKRDTN